MPGLAAGTARAARTAVAIHRVKRACHVIVARSWPASRPNTSRISGAHAAPNRRDPPRFEPIYVEFREAGTLAVSDWSAQPHITLYAAK